MFVFSRVYLLLLLGVVVLGLSVHNEQQVISPQATLPGYKALITQGGLDYATQIALGILQTKLGNINIPDVTGSKDSIDYEITAIKVTGLKIPSGTIKINPGSGFEVAISGISADLTANWHGREKIWPHPSGSGSAQVDLSSVTIDASLQVTQVAGRLNVVAPSVACNIGGMDLHFSGSHLDFLLNLLKDIFGNAIKKSVEDAIRSSVETEIDTTLNDELKSLPVEVVIGKVAELDYTLVAQPEFDPTFFLLPIKAEFYELAHPVEAPFTPTALPSALKSNEQFQGYVDQYVANTASFAFWKAGKMQKTINANEVPADSPIQFNTSYWTSLVPQLDTYYPNWDMSATVSPLAPPVATFTASGGKVFGEGQIEMFVVSPTNGSLYPVFTLGLNISAAGIVAMRGQNVTGNLTSAQSQVWLINSFIGHFDPTQLQSLVVFLTEVVIVPYFNSYLGVGIPIPAFGGFDLVQPTVAWGDGYLFVSADLKYTPA